MQEPGYMIHDAGFRVQKSALAISSPSPYWGEGWGEGEVYFRVNYIIGF